MIIFVLIFFTAALTAEFLAIQKLLSFNPGGFLTGFETFAVYHTIAALLGSLALYIFIELRKKKRKLTLKDFLSGFFQLWLFIFSLGPVGFLLSFLFYREFFQSSIPEVDIKEINYEILSEIQVEVRKFGESITYKITPEAIYYLSKYPHPATIQILKRALSSKNDEVRLLAFSVLAKIERGIFNRIDEILEKLKETKGKREKFILLQRLTELYWELIYLKIADKELENFYLERALFYGKEALKIAENDVLHFYLGRLYLRVGDVKRSVSHFKRALELGFPYYKIASYLMEVYFKESKLPEVYRAAEKFDVETCPEHRLISLVKAWA